MSNPWFQFKQFRIEQQRTALKVGTDGVLLGAWCEVSGCNRILDVGTGSGLIALMVAQRSEAEVTAVEIDSNSSLDAVANFRNSLWSHRLKLCLCDFNRFKESDQPLFDLVVSNPPYFTKSLQSANPAAALARHDGSLSFSQLLEKSRKLLNEQGRLAVVLPAEAFEDFRESARLAGFYLCRKTVVMAKAGRPPKRVLLEFAITGCYPVCDELVILNEEGEYSDRYKSLTREFYLNF